MPRPQLAAAQAWERFLAARSFLVVGAGCVVVGGGVAAVTASSPSEHATWAAAYLVLVAGFAQCALGLGQMWIVMRSPSRWVLTGELITWNVGNLAVLAGTVLGNPALTDAGGVTLVASLFLFSKGTRTARDGWTTLAYRLLVVLVAMSIPIGLLLERTHA